MPSVAKRAADKIRSEIRLAVLISKKPEDCTEEDLLISEAFYLGTKRGYYLAKREFEDTQVA